MDHAKRNGYSFAITVAALTGLLTRQIPASAQEAEAPGIIVVQVVDTAGVTQAGAAVRLFGYDRDGRCWRNLQRELRAESSGTARYDGLSKDESYVVSATADGNLVGFLTALTLGESGHSEFRIKNRAASRRNRSCAFSR
jgi:hypothetical protein